MFSVAGHLTLNDVGFRLKFGGLDRGKVFATLLNVGTRNRLYSIVNKGPPILLSSLMTRSDNGSITIYSTVTES